MFRYALAQVRLEIKRGNSLVASFGGNKSMLGSVSFSRSTERFSAEGDPTGGYVVNENLDSTGEVVISVKQFVPLVDTLTNIFNKYDSDDQDGFGINTENQGAITISAYYRSKLVAVAKGCYLNMPELAFEEEAGDREFTFVAGEVMYERIDTSIQI